MVIFFFTAFRQYTQFCIHSKKFIVESKNHHMYIRVSTSTVQLFVIYIQTLTNFLLLFEFAQIIMKSKKILVAFSKVPQLLSQTFE